MCEPTQYVKNIENAVAPFDFPDAKLLLCSFIRDQTQEPKATHAAEV